MQFVDNLKAKAREETRRALIKALPWGIGTGLMFILTVKTVGIGAIVTIFTNLHTILIVLIALLLAGCLLMAVVAIGGTINIQHGMWKAERAKRTKRTWRLWRRKKAAAAEAQAESSVVVEPVGLLTVSEPPPVEGFAAVLRWMFSRDRPEAR